MKVILLISSGIDSPVAGVMMKERGLEVIALHMDLLPNAKEADKVTRLAKKIGVKKLLFASIQEVHEAYRQKCNPRYTCLFCKRTMLRAAEAIAKSEGCEAIVTGENMGQVASQTLDSIYVTDDAVEMKILRPLLAFDKNDAVEHAKKYGTYNLSIEKSPVCPFLPDHPATRPQLDKVKTEEEKLDLKRLMEEVVKNTKTIY
ncbi:7-cyano-7-deazaguanine synthase [Candidatus Woesearchaeota archaeon]|nr:7-cyano-7-deazaguanine synthase [Candidatus Woesearchaeota archaeon]